MKTPNRRIIIGAMIGAGVIAGVCDSRCRGSSIL